MSKDDKTYIARPVTTCTDIGGGKRICVTISLLDCCKNKQPNNGQNKENEQQSDRNSQSDPCAQYRNSDAGQQKNEPQPNEQTPSSPYLYCPPPEPPKEDKKGPEMHRCCYSAESYQSSPEEEQIKESPVVEQQPTEKDVHVPECPLHEVDKLKDKINFDC